jgi:plastocyanin
VRITHLMKRPTCHVLVTLLILVWLGGCGQSLPRDTTLEVVATEMAFSPTALEATQGEMITIRLVNNGKEAHNLLVELPSGTRQIGAEDGVDAVLTFPASDQGTFRFYCSIPGHEAMEGTLTIR